MKIVAECPVMLSDRPETTPKSLDLEVSPTCLGEKERELLGDLGRFGAGRERDIPYKSSLATLPVLRRRRLSGIPWRTVHL